ncbi:STAS domain-containing protein [Amycolatopsis pigmentata]|uniref:Anti-sigma factor antagonist n=1 Tax=Amycolatopsis pigmentata TaxID=450801 RepID=A0ABW5G278_9PSEU
MTPPDALPPGDPSAPVMTVRLEQRDSGVVVLHVAGEIDLVTAPDLEEAIERALKERPKILVVDLSAVDFLASAGMSVLVAAHNQAGTATDMRFVATGSATFRPMELTGLSQALDIYQSLSEALPGV